MTKFERIKFERFMTKIFEDLIIKSDYQGKYVSLTPGHKNYIEDEE